MPSAPAPQGAGRTAARRLPHRRHRERHRAPLHRAAARARERQQPADHASTSTAPAATSPTASPSTTSSATSSAAASRSSIIVQGMAYSMGSIVLQAASDGRRLTYPALVDHDSRAGEVGRLAVDDRRRAAPRAAEADAGSDLQDPVVRAPASRSARSSGTPSAPTSISTRRTRSTTASIDGIVAGELPEPKPVGRRDAGARSR